MNRPIQLIVIALALTASLIAAPNDPSLQPVAPGATPSPQESATLADACRLTQLMNEDKWDEVEKALGTKEGMIALLRQNAGLKDWPGIGAYRGTTHDAKFSRIIHRFGFAPRTNPHEISLSYTITESGISKPSLMVMGW